MTAPTPTDAARARRRNLIPLALGVAALAAVLVFRAQLSAWFLGDDSAEPTETATTAEPTPAAHPGALAPARAQLGRALGAYETLRAELAGDRTGKLAAPAAAVAESLRAARKFAPEAFGAELERGAAAAEKLGGAADLDAARTAFSELSASMVALAAADPEVGEGEHLYECPMWKQGFNKWLQPSAELENPFMGTKMPTCGNEVEMAGAAASAAAAPAAGDDAIDHYTCPMDSWVEAKKPGTCPVCGMDLVPVTREEVRTGVLRIDHRRRQLIGLKTALAERRTMSKTIRAVGRVAYDETRIADVTVRLGGYVRDLTVEALGERVRRGQRLFSIYSPDLYTAQKEYLLALEQKKSAASEAGKERAAALLRGARQRLLLWQLSPRQIEALGRRGEPREYLAITSPAAGFVVEKNVVEGAAVEAGQRLFRIADLDRVWVEAEVYEEDIAQIQVGQEARVSLTHMPGKRYTGKVSFIYPYLDKKSRTARVRVELPNRGLELKPDMYADVELDSPAGERLAIPEAAVIYSGPRRIVFVDAGDDKLVPRLVEVGIKADGYFEVRSGLEPGERVVTSGNFLISAESRLKAATGLW